MEINHKKKKYAWIGYTFLFVITIMTLLTVILWKPLIGLFVTLVIVLTIFVGSVLKAFCQKEYRDVKKSDLIRPIIEKDIYNSQKLLRYSAAVLAFISLTTTANGMKSFVFDFSWLAYLGSFAVQSILVVFSLLLCRFFVQVTVLSWPAYIKRLTNGLMILFFCVVFTVSSIFSFSYIANNAYKDSWANDSETIIQNYLLDAVYQLRAENERRGEIILNNINNTAKDKLIGVIDTIRKQEELELNEELLRKIELFDYEKLDENKVDIDKEEWIRQYPQYDEHIEQLYSDYNNTYRSGYANAVQVYNDIVDTIKACENYSDVMAKTANISHKIDEACNSLQSLINVIDDWKTSRLVNDVSIYRARFEAASNTLIKEFDNLETYIIDLQRISEDLDSKIRDSSTSEELERLLSQVYLLGINADIQLNELIKSISELSIEVFNSEEFNGDVIQNIVSFRDDLMRYSDYLILKNELDTYIDSRLKRTYHIKADSEIISASAAEESTEVTTDEQFIYTISEIEWKNCRNDDFDLFYTYVKLLPDFSRIDSGMTDGYDVNIVLNEASILQRDLLGELTDFEKAFNYFKYQFPVMAYFSAFIAVFFDLGAFFTGCFLYVTEYFEKKSETCAHIEC